MNVAKIAFDNNYQSEVIREDTLFQMKQQIDDLYSKLRNINNAIEDRGTVGDVITPFDDTAVNRAASLYGERRRRAKFFEDDLFGEPAWDILLDLVIQAGKGKQVSVTSACIASSVPPTTALRWLSVLETRGLIFRKNDDLDRRRNYVGLSEQGRKLMDAYLTNSEPPKV